MQSMNYNPAKAAESAKLAKQMEEFLAKGNKVYKAEAPKPSLKTIPKLDDGTPMKFKGDPAFEQLYLLAGNVWRAAKLINMNFTTYKRRLDGRVSPNKQQLAAVNEAIEALRSKAS